MKTIAWQARRHALAPGAPAPAALARAAPAPAALARAAGVAAALGAFGALGGCEVDASDFDDSRAEGELGRGDFKYGCVSPSDVACEYRCTLLQCEATSTNEKASTFPDRVAVGALFSLSYDDEGGGASSRYRVVPAAPSWVDAVGPTATQLDGDAETFSARRPGRLAFLARNRAGRVADLLHVEFVPLHHLEVNNFGAARAVVPLEPEQTFALQAYPQGADGRQLGGALTYRWTASDESVANLTYGAASDRVEVRAKAPGRAVVRVSAGDVSTEVSFQVGGQ